MSLQWYDFCRNYYEFDRLLQVEAAARAYRDESCKLDPDMEETAKRFAALNEKLNIPRKGERIKLSTVLMVWWHSLEIYGL